MRRKAPDFDTLPGAAAGVTPRAATSHFHAADSRFSWLPLIADYAIDATPRIFSRAPLAAISLPPIIISLRRRRAARRQRGAMTFYFMPRRAAR
jgi:hypothetical protein